MVKTFNFYLGILVRTRVYTNTDLMGLSVCVLYFFFLFLSGLNGGVTDLVSLKEHFDFLILYTPWGDHCYPHALD